MTGILDRLEKRDMVERIRLKTDKRKVQVVLTDKARELVSAAPPPLHKPFTERLAQLSLEEQMNIDETLRRIVAMMEAEKLDAAPLMVTEAILTEADDGLD